MGQVGKRSSNRLTALLMVALSSASASASLPEECPTREAGKARVRYLSDNVDAWEARMQLIMRARKLVLAQYYILEPDEYGYAFLGALLYKARAGVKVKLMVDAKWNPGLVRKKYWMKNSLVDKIASSKGFTGEQDLLQELVAAGAEVIVYAPFLRKGIQAHLTAGNHDKLIIVDDCYTITGGRNIGDTYFKDPSEQAKVYMDADVLAESVSVAQEATQAFEFERVHRAENNHWISKDFLGNWDNKTSMLLDALIRATQRYRKGHPFLRGEFFESDTRVLARIVDSISAVHTDIKRNDIAIEFIRQVGKAKREIIIQSPYFIPTQIMKNVLQTAARRGVRIVLHTNSPLSSDNFPSQAMFNKEWRQHLKDIPGMNIFVNRGPQMLHSKVFIFDRKVAFIGSYNFDPISDRLNSEVGLLVEDDAFARDIVARVVAEQIRGHAVEYVDRKGGGPEQLTGGAEAAAALESFQQKIDRGQKLFDVEFWRDYL